MKWFVKAALQRTIDLFAAREQINYFFQKNITKNLPVSDATLEEKITIAAARTALFGQYSDGRLIADAHFLEFGAGWDMIGPLAMYALGVGKQTLLDLTPHLRFELITDALERLRSRGELFRTISRGSARTFASGSVENTGDLLRKFAIDYRSPVDAAKTGLDEGSIDFISTNSTLEHIPAADLPAIMCESWRILRRGGLLCHFIDMKDHYSYFDRSISKYNFLKFSERGWRLANSPMQYQNRLRLPEYRKLVTDAGFEIAFEEIVGASDDELNALRKLKIHPDFRGRFTETELSAQIYRVVARKP